MGLGCELTLLFAKKHKCNLIIFDINDERLDILESKVRELGANIHFFKCDVSNLEEVTKIIQKISFKFKHIDILINNAGIVQGKLFEEETVENIEKTLKVNYMGPVYMSKLLLPLMIENKKGHIVNISSIMAFAPGIGVADYCASKTALLCFHNNLKREINEKKMPIDLTLVCPYVVDTGMFEGIKIKFSRFLGFLQTQDVANIIYEGICSKKNIVIIPWYYIFILFAMSITPQIISDKILLYLRK